jgi:hypothetical protein
VALVTALPLPILGGAVSSGRSARSSPVIDFSGARDRKVGKEEVVAGIAM